jgi:hypothetical protein
LGGCVIDQGELITYHVTDNPKRVCSIKKDPRSLVETGDTGIELGPGLYASGAPDFWKSRSTEKYKFLERLTPVELERLTDAMNKEKERKFLTDSEKERLERDINYVKEEKMLPQVLAIYAGQPYNIQFWKPDFLKGIDIKPSKQPDVIEMKLTGKFGELNSRMDISNYPEKLACLRNELDGVFTRAGMNTNPEMVIWKKKAIEQMNGICGDLDSR